MKKVASSVQSKNQIMNDKKKYIQEKIIKLYKKEEN